MFNSINSRNIPSLRVAIACGGRSAIALQADQPPQLASPNHSIKSVTSIFLTFLFIGFILGCLLQHKRDKKKRVIHIFRETKTLETIEKITPETQSQIETLESIWNKS
ncbi:hypothetical protein [Anabaena sp. CCY 0017]|uniref:hypothetical protein n=1 Tax=Anabaena sp. CCY 0017 TaxID=3103866 RepID=UPI0039C6A55A